MVTATWNCRTDLVHNKGEFLASTGYRPRLDVSAVSSKSLFHQRMRQIDRPIRLRKICVRGIRQSQPVP